MISASTGFSFVTLVEGFGSPVNNFGELVEEHLLKKSPSGIERLTCIVEP